MKAILNLRKHYYLKMVSVFLIAVLLIVGVVSCEGEGETYDLTMAVNPAAGGTATDETGESPYGVLDVVDIKAVPADCYRFVNWEAPAGVFGNSTAAETTFIMPARDVTVTANFEPVPADHFKLYFAEWQGGEPPATLPVDVQLKDQFGTFNATVGEVYWFGNPVKKVDGDTTTPISDRDRHYTYYHLEHEEGWEPQYFKVTVNNQFQDDVELTVWGPTFLAVPTQKEDQEMSDCLDHLLVYNILRPIEYSPEPIGEVDLYDQFHDELGVTVYEPMFFANPVQKTVLPGGSATPIKLDEHYVFYPIDEEFVKSGVQITNQFGDQTLDIGNPALLAVPSEKIDWEQPLNHFKTYWATWADEPPMYGVPVQLEDQFVTLNATVWDLWLFANPVEKWTEEDEVPTAPIWDPKDHLTFYNIAYKEDPQVWEVTVNNQFGKGQVLTIEGPYYLAVPTQKEDQDPPVGLNHFLVYDVVYYPDLPYEQVFLVDQFNWPEGEIVWRYEPEYFAVPVKKTYDGVVTPILDDTHLLFYWIDGGTASNKVPLPIDNQFGEQLLWWSQMSYDLLGVPSEKTNVEGPWPYEF